MEEFIKDWYEAEYPTDEWAISVMNELTTFESLFNTLDRHEDVYAYLFKDDNADSIVRERIFIKLAEVMNVTYDYVYEQWLLTKPTKLAIKVFKGQELRDSTKSNYVIFFEGKELPTSKSGAINSNNGIVLTARLPTGEMIKWRSNDNYGKKGFSYDKPINTAKEDSKVNAISAELRNKLEYKL